MCAYRNFATSRSIASVSQTNPLIQSICASREVKLGQLPFLDFGCYFRNSGPLQARFACSIDEFPEWYQRRKFGRTLLDLRYSVWRRKEGFFAEERLNATGEQFHAVFRQCPAKPSALGNLGELPREVHGAHQDGCIGYDFRDLLSCVQPVHSGHQEVEDNQVRLELLGLGNGIPAIGRLAADFPVRILFEQIAEYLPHVRIVVGDEDAGGHGHQSQKIGELTLTIKRHLQLPPDQVTPRC